MFIHGTASSSGRWADLVNDLQSDPVIRDHFQFWWFSYSTGNPSPFSALRLRTAIEDAAHELDPKGKDSMLRQIVLIGHSQGGLLAKMLVIDNGSRKASAPIRSWACPGGQQEAQRVAEGVDQSVDFGAQSALAAADRLIVIFFLGAPALCWWARTMVLSIIAYSLSASAARCSKRRCHAPFLAQRLNRLCEFFQSPNRSGKSRQGIPARYRASPSGR